MARTSKDLPDSTLTRMQELGSAWVFKRAIQDNAVWSSWEQIKEDNDTYDEIKKIWKTVGGVMWDDAADDGTYVFSWPVSPWGLRRNE